MTRKNTLLLVLLGALLLLILLPRLLPERRDYPERLAEIDTAAVSRVTIARGADSVAVERREGGWWLVHPIAWKADGRTVAGMLESLADLRVAALATANDSLRADGKYDLDQGRAARVRVFSGNVPALELRVGRASRDFQGSFVRREGEEPIYRLAGELAGRLPASRRRWLDKDIFRVEPDSLAALWIRRDDGVLAFARADSLWRVDWNPARGTGWTGARTAEDSFPALVSTLCALRLSDLASPEQAAMLAAAPPLVQHQLRLRDGRAVDFQWALLAEDSTHVFLRRGGDATWFATYRGMTERLTAPPGTFRRGE